MEKTHREGIVLGFVHWLGVGFVQFSIKRKHDISLSLTTRQLQACLFPTVFFLFFLSKSNLAVFTKISFRYPFSIFAFLGYFFFKYHPKFFQCLFNFFLIAANYYKYVIFKLWISNIQPPHPILHKIQSHIF